MKTDSNTQKLARKFLKSMLQVQNNLDILFITYNSMYESNKVLLTKIAFAELYYNAIQQKTIEDTLTTAMNFISDTYKNSSSIYECWGKYSVYMNNCTEIVTYNQFKKICKSFNLKEGGKI